MTRTPFVTARLTLTPLSTSHEGELLALLSLPEVSRSLLDGETVAEPFVRQMIDDSDEAFRAHGLGIFLALDDTEGLVGLAGFRVFPGELQLLYAVHPSKQGRGYGAEMARALVALAFDERGFDEVSASTHEDNTPSRRLLERLGMELVRREQGPEQGELYYRLRRSG